MLSWMLKRGRKFIAGTGASFLLLIGFLFVALTGKGNDAFPAFVTGVVSIYGLFSGGNALSTLAEKKKAPADDLS